MSDGTFFHVAAQTMWAGAVLYNTLSPCDFQTVLCIRIACLESSLFTITMNNSRTTLGFKVCMIRTV